MTKILYVVGGGSERYDGSVHDDIELRWSLRSLEKFATDEVEPVIVGRVPKWFRGYGVTAEDPTNRKAKNVMHKVLTAVESGLVTGAFQISADDHFWIRPRNFAELPIYWREAMLPEWLGEGNNYVKAMAGTRETLLDNGYPAINTTCHSNAWCHADDAPEVEMLAERAGPLGKEYGLLAWAVWPNLYIMRKTGRKLAHLKDLKFGTVGPDRFRRETEGAEMFSINDDAFSSPCVMEYLRTTFGGKCRWES